MLVVRTLFGFCLALSIMIPVTSGAQEQMTRSYLDIGPRELVDVPTARTLPRGCFDINFRVYPHGGLLGTVSIGLSRRFMVGVSYGAEGIISDQKADWNPRLEFNAKLRLIDEEYFLPAIAVGFNSQGYGSYDESVGRYVYKSKGIYGVVSRSLYFYKWSFGGHAGISYSLENEKDHDDEPDLFFGIDSRFSRDVGFVVEYDLALNDNRSGNEFGRGRGYLNAGVKWLFSDNLEIEAVFKNLLDNRRGVNSFDRGIRLTYVEFL